MGINYSKDKKVCLSMVSANEVMILYQQQIGWRYTPTSNTCSQYLSIVYSYL